MIKVKTKILKRVVISAALFVSGCAQQKTSIVVTKEMHIPLIDGEFAVSPIDFNEELLYLVNNLGPTNDFKADKVYSVDRNNRITLTSTFEMTYLLSFTEVNGIKYYAFYDANISYLDGFFYQFRIARQVGSEEIETIYQGLIRMELFTPQFVEYNGKVYALVVSYDKVDEQYYNRVQFLYNVTDDEEFHVSSETINMTAPTENEYFPNTNNISFPDKYLVFTTAIYDYSTGVAGGKIFIFDGEKLVFHHYRDIYIADAMTCGEYIVFNDHSNQKYLIQISNPSRVEKVGLPLAEVLIPVLVEKDRIYYLQDRADGGEQMKLMIINFEGGYNIEEESMKISFPNDSFGFLGARGYARRIFNEQDRIEVAIQKIVLE